MKARSHTRWFFLGGIALMAAAELALRTAPLPASLGMPPQAGTEILDRHGQPLRILLVDGRRYQRSAKLEDLPPHVIAATLAAEDSRFFQHPGIDPRAILRALFNALRGATPVSGASTITQQLAKQAANGPRTIPQKLREAALALRLERVWSKNRILEEYLNRLDYGGLRIGIAAASQYYFGKPPSDLSAAEGAFLAALPKAPGRLNPHRNLSAARERQRWILGRMQKLGSLPQAALTRALEEPLALQSARQDFAAPHFVDLLLQRRDLLSPVGGPLRTTLDLELTLHVERCLTTQLAGLTAHNVSGAAAVVLHNPTGEVLALAGSGDYFSAGAGQVNGAWVPRSPGSALKPFTYLLALEHGATPATIVADVPTTFSTPTGLYRPNNYNHRFHGPVTLRHALGNSLNVAAIHTLQNVGGPPELHRLLRQLGLSTLNQPPDYYGLGLTLGNGEVRLLELANAYGTLARGGLHRPFRLLLDPNNTPGQGRRLFSRSSAYLLSHMLADNRARSAAFGLESHLALPFPAACKTGTSSDYRDNWSIGYTPDFTVAVWVGNPNGRPMREITGVTGAAPAMHGIFLHLHQTHGTTWFSKPPDIREGHVHPLTGHTVAASHPAAMREIFLNPPPNETPADYDASGRVVLPAAYREWIESPQNGLGELAACSTAPPPLRITSPTPGTIYFLDPDLPTAVQRISLQAESAEPLEWSSPTLASEHTPNGPMLALREGTHHITTRATLTGQIATTWITVHPL